MTPDEQGPPKLDIDATRECLNGLGLAHADDGISSHAQTRYCIATDRSGGTLWI